MNYNSIKKLRSGMIVKLRRLLQIIYSVRLKRYPQLRELLEQFAKSHSAAVDTADATALYEYIIRLKPRHILEMGSGTSTNIICLAISEIQNTDPAYQPTFHSIEEEAEWLDYRERTFVPNLRKFVTLLHSTTEKREFGKLGGQLATRIFRMKNLTLFLLMAPISTSSVQTGLAM